mgnify:CR=1 FL=1
MKQIKLIIKTNTQKYPIIIGSSLITNISSILKKNLIKFQKILIIVDNKVPKKFVNIIKKSLDKKKYNLLFINANEKNKSQKTLNNILNILLDKNFSRKDCLITLGGGITGDLGGFAASLFKRGMQFVNIPTTLLSQVDSSIGGKTGINSKFGKNLIGSFYQPKLVVSDTIFLKTLPKREIICGYGEILKHSLISDKKFFNFLNNNVLNILNLRSPFIEKSIYKSCKIKKEIVEKDEKEENLRKILNFGHTFAHAYEGAMKFSKKLNHGEAVLLGISSAINFGINKKLLIEKDFFLIKNHLKKLNLPHKISKYFEKKDVNNILSFMQKDKKNKNNKINLVLLKKIGIAKSNYYIGNNVLKKFFLRELNN